MDRESQWGVVLVGHGAVAKDCPRELVQRFKAAEARRQATGDEPTAEEQELEQRIRRWPRTSANDTYQAGMEALAERLQPLLQDGLLAVAYNEFCAPSVEEAVHDLVQKGAEEIKVVSTMMTPGGVHSETDIPHALQRARAASPGVAIRYAWPFDLDRLAEMLAAHLSNHAGG
jgi:sirohydrochlorin cobaltochelatase